METIDIESATGMRRITAREFQQMYERKILDDEPERLELLGGVIYSTMADGHPHRRTSNLLNRLLTTRFPAPFIVQAGISLHLGQYDVPSPDFVVYREGGDAYTSFVDMRTVILAIEVADTSLRKDRLLKQRRYALAAVPEYWIVNVNGPEVDVYSDPRDGTYASFHRFAPEEAIVSSAFPGEPVRPRELVLP